MKAILPQPIRVVDKTFPEKHTELANFRTICNGQKVRKTSLSKTIIAIINIDRSNVRLPLLYTGGKTFD